MEKELIFLRDQPHWKEAAAKWFHEKWGIPEDAYMESMADCIENREAVPQWYIIVEGQRIVGGCGIIENDFHVRKDLTPNVCAVFVEEECRCQGLAGLLLDTACSDLGAHGVKDAYLLTNHTSFYERYGWAYLCMVQEDGGGTARIYHRKCN